MQRIPWEKYDVKRYRRFIQENGGKQFRNCNAAVFPISDDAEAFVSYYTLIAVFTKKNKLLFVNTEKFSGSTSRQLTWYKNDLKNFHQYSLQKLLWCLGEGGEAEKDLQTLRDFFSEVKKDAEM